MIAPERMRDPAAAHVPGRDGARTPMPWDAEPFAGFSTRRALAAAAGDFATVNVAAERADPASLSISTGA